MGLAEILPCPMLLGVNWPHLKGVVSQVLRRSGGEWQDDSDAICFGTPEEEEGRDLDLEQNIGDGYFREKQEQKPLFWNVWQTQLARRKGEVVDSEQASLNPHFKVRTGILYRVENQKEGGKKQQVLVPQKYWQDLLQVAHTLPMRGHLGKDKMETRLKQWVFWPGLYKMVERFYVECPECQKTGAKAAQGPIETNATGGAPI